MADRTYWGHTNLVGREFQDHDLHDVLRRVANHLYDNRGRDPISVSTFFDTEAEEWTVVLVTDD